MPNTNRHRSYDTHHHHPTATHHSPPKRHPKLLSIFLKFIVMSLILCLFLIFLGLATIILLHILLVGSFVRRRRRRHRRNITPPPTSSYSLIDLQTHLPSFPYSAAAATFSGDCSICLENFKECELCRSLPECGHVFHAHCVDSWLTKVPNCPVCRRRVRLEVGRPADPIDGDDDSKFMWVIGVGRQIGVNY